jgi:Family of unknown function (DUF5335)
MLHIAGTATTAHSSDWPQPLDAFTRRHAGHPACIEIDDPAVGAQRIGSGFALTGVTYDPHGKRVEIMLADPADARRHLMHPVPSVDSISMTVGGLGDEVLALRHGRGQTLVCVAPALPARANRDPMT